MKKTKIFFSLLAAVSFSLTSCLKEHSKNIDLEQGPSNLIQFANTGDDVAGSQSVYPRFTSDLGSVKNGQTVTFPINLNYAGVDAAPTDITVNLELDAALLTQFNTENGTTYVMPSTDIFNFPRTATIKQGERRAQIMVSITNTANFDFNKNYALPIKIASASAGKISGNFGKAVYSFSARNMYDGVYTMEATSPMVDLAAATITGWYPAEMSLITYTGNSVALFDLTYSGTYGHPIKSAGSGSYYGSFSPVFFFDATGKITSVTNYYGQESGGNKRSAVLDPTGVNKATFNADGSIKTIEVSYVMTQSVASPMAPRTYFKEKFTFQHAR